MPQWTGADTLEYNVRSDPVVRTDPPSPEPPNIYVSRRYVSLLTRSDCLPIVYSVTSSGGEEEYHYAIIALTAMKFFRDTGTLAISKTAGAPSIIADTLTGVNNLYVPVTPKFNPAFIGWSPDSKTSTPTTAFLSPG